MVSGSLKDKHTVSCGRDEASQSEQPEDHIRSFLQIIPVTGEIRYNYLSECLINFVITTIPQPCGLIFTETIYITLNTSLLLAFAAGYHGMAAEELGGGGTTVSILTSCMNSIL